MKILSEYSLGDMSVRYVLAEDGQVGMELYPASMKPFIKEGRRYQVDPLVQWKKEGDAFPYGFANGMTMRNSETVSRMEYKEQKVEQSEEGICVTTVLEDALGSEILHILRYKNGDPALWVSTGIRNLGKKPIVLEFLASFSVGGITPFAEDEAVVTYKLRNVRIGGLAIPASLPPVAFNAVIIGIEIAVLFPEPGSSAPLWLACVSNGISVGIGELISCTVLGVLLVKIIESNTALKKIFE